MVIVLFILCLSEPPSARSMHIGKFKECVNLFQKSVQMSLTTLVAVSSYSTYQYQYLSVETNGSRELSSSTVPVRIRMRPIVHKTPNLKSKNENSGIEVT